MLLTDDRIFKDNAERKDMSRKMMNAVDLCDCEADIETWRKEHFLELTAIYEDSKQSNHDWNLYEALEEYVENRRSKIIAKENEYVFRG